MAMEITDNIGNIISTAWQNWFQAWIVGLEPLMHQLKAVKL